MSVNKNATHQEKQIQRASRKTLSMHWDLTIRHQDISRLHQARETRKRNDGNQVSSPISCKTSFTTSCSNGRHASKVTNDSSGEWVCWRYSNVSELLWYSKLPWDHVMSFIDDDNPLRNHFLLLSGVKFTAKRAALNKYRNN